MSGLYRATAVVLRTYKLGESDRIVVFCAREHGRIKAVAKGIRKTKSKFGARLEPGSHVAIQAYKGKGELDIVTQVETIDSFRKTREDLDRVKRQMSMLEAVEGLLVDDRLQYRLYETLVRALRELDRANSSLIVGAFYWRLLSLEGVLPNFHSCISCGDTDGLQSFSLREGGVLCGRCKPGKNLTKTALSLLQRSTGGQLSSVLDEVNSIAEHEYMNLAAEAMEAHLERRLKTKLVAI